jgi:hypothetical protein
MRYFLLFIFSGIICWNVSAQQPVFPSDKQKKSLKKASKFVLKPIEEQLFEHSFPDPPKNLKFPLIKFNKNDILLEKMTPEVEFKAGTTPEITYRLINLSLKRIIVYEWYMKETNNITIYYTPWEDGMKLPPFKDWKKIAPKIGKKPRRMTLDIRHRNSTLINVPFSFFKNLKLYTTKEFLVFAKLNLTSLPVKSRITKIRIIP